MKSILAWAPANISCIFKPVIGKDSLHTGSIGLGFTINEGVTVEVSFSDKTDIFFNESKILLPTVEAITRNLISPTRPKVTHIPTVKISIFSPLPLGCGFGISGASAIASAFALNVLLNLKKKPLDLAKIAHCAEVENRTGLGDVINQFIGGCLLKIKPSYMFEAKKLPLEGIPIYCKIFGSLETKDVLSDAQMQSKISVAANKALRNVIMASEKRARPGSLYHNTTYERDSGQARMTMFSHLIQISKQFALQSGLLKNKQVKDAISTIEKKGGFACMIMLGNAVISNIPFEGAKEYNISSNKAHIIILKDHSK